MNRIYSNTQSRRLSDGRYVYYPANGTPVYLIPGVDVSEEIIIMLHDMDCEAARRDRVEEDHRYDMGRRRPLEKDNLSTHSTDPVEALPDTTADIFCQLFPEEEPANNALRVLEKCIPLLTPRQQDYIRERFGMRMTIEEIGNRYGVTPQAINNRQNKIYRRLKKLMAERGIT